MNLKFISWNINGLNDKKKRNRVGHTLKKSNWDAICLQETHVNKKHERVLINTKLGVEFITADEKKKRGVVIYVKRKWEPELIWKDKEGRIIIVRIMVEGEQMIIAGIYAPNGSKKKFFKNLERILMDYQDKQIVVLGDFNGVTEPELDRSNNKKKEGKINYLIAFLKW